jgi:hypothetical protein
MPGGSAKSLVRQELRVAVARSAATRRRRGRDRVRISTMDAQIPAGPVAAAIDALDRASGRFWFRSPALSGTPSGAFLKSQRPREG